MPGWELLQLFFMSLNPQILLTLISRVWYSHFHSYHLDLAVIISYLSYVHSLLPWLLLVHSQHSNQHKPFMPCLITTFLCSEPCNGSHLMPDGSQSPSCGLQALSVTFLCDLSHSSPCLLPVLMLLWPPWPSCCSGSLPGLLLPQGLCTCYALCLDHSSLGYPLLVTGFPHSLKVEHSYKTFSEPK